MENPQANGTVDGQTKDAELAEELQEGATSRRKQIASSERTRNWADDEDCTVWRANGRARV